MCQQDGSCASAKDWVKRAELFQRIKKAVFFKKLEHRGGFAAGQDETVEAGKLFELAHLDREGPGICQSLCVSCIVTLNGQYANAQGQTILGQSRLPSGIRRLTSLASAGAAIHRELPRRDPSWYR